MLVALPLRSNPVISRNRKWSERRIQRRQKHDVVDVGISHSAHAADLEAAPLYRQIDYPAHSCLLARRMDLPENSRLCRLDDCVKDSGLSSVSGFELSLVGVFLDHVLFIGIFYRDQMTILVFLKPQLTMPEPCPP